MMRELTSFLIYTKHGYVIRSTHLLVLVFIWGSQSKGCWLNGSHEDLKQLFSSVTKYKVTKYCYHIFLLLQLCYYLFYKGISTRSDRKSREEPSEAECMLTPA